MDSILSLPSILRCRLVSCLITWRWRAMILIWSWWSCGTPYVGYISCISIVENVTVVLLSLSIQYFLICVKVKLIVLTTVPLYLVIYPLQNVDLYFGILAAEVPGVQFVSCILFIFLSIDEWKPRDARLPLTEILILIVWSIRSDDTVTWGGR